jgi:hypothetical protein
MENMKLLKNNKTVYPIYFVYSFTSFTPFTLSKHEKVNDGKRTPFTLFMCQPCGYEGKVNEVNAVNRKSDFAKDLGKRAKITPFTEARLSLWRCGYDL